MVDYKVITEDGLEFTIESNSPDDSKKRLAAYYNALLQHSKETEDEHTTKAIDYVISNMADDEVTDLEKDVASKDKMFIETITKPSEDAMAKRLMAYMKAFQQLSEKQKSIAEPMQEVVDKYKKFDFDTLVKEEINGNTFTYRKGKFPIEQYRAELEELGEKSKGNQWSVSVTSEGRLVIY